MKIKTNIENFLNQTSEHQGLFKYDARRNDYMLMKGRYTGKFINDMIPEFQEDVLEMLDEIYNHEESNYHTKKVIDEIINQINS